MELFKNISAVVGICDCIGLMLVSGTSLLKFQLLLYNISLAVCQYKKPKPVLWIWLVKYWCLARGNEGNLYETSAYRAVIDGMMGRKGMKRIQKIIVNIEILTHFVCIR